MNTHVSLQWQSRAHPSYVNKKSLPVLTERAVTTNFDEWIGAPSWHMSEYGIVQMGGVEIGLSEKIPKNWIIV